MTRLGAMYGIAGAALLAAAAPAGMHAQAVAIGGSRGGQNIEIIQNGTGPAVLAGNETMPTGTGLIVGRTVEADGVRPVAGAIVILRLPGSAPLRALTDGQGNFAFSDLPKGRFDITASKPGFADGAYGRVRPSGQSQPIELTDGQRVSNAIVPLWKFAAVTGRVLDEAGEPMVGASVEAFKRTFVAGKRQLGQPVSDRTDDRGIYRIGSLEPGEYVVAIPMTQSSLPAILKTLGRDVAAMPPPGGGAPVRVAFRAEVSSTGGGGGGGGTFVFDSSDANSPPAGVDDDGRPLAYPTTFFPGTVSASRADVVGLRPGEERSGIDFQLAPARAATVSGFLAGPDGPAANVAVTLLPSEADDLVAPIEVATAFTDAMGAFRFERVPAGAYTVRASRMPRAAAVRGRMMIVQSTGGNVTIPSSGTLSTDKAAVAPPLPREPTLWTESSLSVGGQDITGLTLTMNQGLRVFGRVDFVGAAERPKPEDLPAIDLSLEPADGRTSGIASSARGRVETTGQFATMGVPAGRYVLRVSAPGGWSLGGAMLGGRDITSVPIELKEADLAGVVITFTDQPSSLTGNVTNDTGAPDATAAVLLFPAERDGWSGFGPTPRRLRHVRVGRDGSVLDSQCPGGPVLSHRGERRHHGRLAESRDPRGARRRGLGRAARPGRTQDDEPANDARRPAGRPALVRPSCAEHVPLLIASCSE